MTVKEVVSHIREKKPGITILGEGVADHWYSVKLRGKAQEGDFDVWQSCSPMAVPEARMSGGAAAVSENVETLTKRRVQRIGSSGTMKYRFWDFESERIVCRCDWDTYRDCSWLGHGPPHYNIIISDYGKGMFSWPVLRRLTDYHSKSRVVFSPHINNCKSWTPSEMNGRMREWTWVVNEAEFEALCRARFGQATANYTVVTRGHRDVLLAETRYFYVKRVEVAHTVAIGDVFLASFSAAYFSELTLGESIEFAISVCGNVLKAKRFGTCQIQEEDLR